MLDSFFKFILRQQLFALKEFCMERRLSKLQLRHKVDQGHLKKLIDFYKLHSNRKRYNRPSTF